MNESFAKLVSEIPRIGLDWHTDRLIENSKHAASLDERLTVRSIQHRVRDALIVSAGPSLYRNEILQRLAKLRYHGAVICIDGSLVQCLRNQILPHYCVTLDPHPTRIVRWFGDPDFAVNAEGDDYFSRQDLDENFRTDAERTNAENIRLVDDNAMQIALVISSTAPENVERRTRSVFGLRYWFSPLVDNPNTSVSLTRKMAEITGFPSMNTGGTVGTAAVIFAHCILRAKRIAVVGMDLGYHKDTPLERTQSWNMLKERNDVIDLYPKVNHPVYGECYTDATYHWYRQNLLALLRAGDFQITNCSEGGALFGPRVNHQALEDWANG